MTFDRERVRALLQSLRRRHDIVEDCWYTCPKAIVDNPDNEEARCCNDDLADAGECTCGADAHNARLDELAIALGFTPPAPPTGRRSTLVI